MRLSREVTKQDVLQSIELMNSATLKSATDPDTGLVNMELITAGKSASIKRREEEATAAIKSILLAN
jgi:DNA replicative helicase MCM subunit Mcm2 (Cdc46/Mcm family)